MPHPVVTVAATPSHVAGKIKSSSAPPTSAKVRVVGKPHEDVANGTGCLVCGNHDNEEKILLCEQCDGEYHTFCVQLDDIPEGEWYCEKCCSDNTGSINDGLDLQVAALPPSITSRYGQIVWAQGGQSYGWWPAIIFDPRKTVEPARSQARKCLKSKQLCYFYQCEETPFSILASKKIKDWIEGLAEDFHLGKAAKSHGKLRYKAFLQAMEVACLEQEKSVQERLDWEHTSSAAAAAERQQQPQLLSPSAAVEKKKRKRSGASKSSESNKIPRSVNRALLISSRGEHTTSLSRTESASSQSFVSGVVPDDRELVCTIKYLDARAAGPVLDGTSDDSKPESKAVGFIVLKSRQTSTFREARAAIEDELMGDSLPATLKWRFFVPRLGPVALKQEASLGMIQFTGYPSAGDSYQSPLELYVMCEDAKE